MTAGEIKGFDGVLFNGVQANGLALTIRPHRSGLELIGETIRVLRPSEIEIENRHSDRTPLVFKLSDGSVVQFAASEREESAWRTHLKKAKPLIAFLQMNELAILASLCASVLVFAVLYFKILPVVGDWAALNMPEHKAAAIERDALKAADAILLKPSTLNIDQKLAINRKFLKLKSPNDRYPVKLEFRSSKVGPNAFAFPNGTIVLTDELVRLIGDGDALMAVLAHEIGHVQKRHSLRLMTQQKLLQTLATFMIGDLSSLSGQMALQVMSQGYSRQAERESDLFAVRRFQEKGMKLEDMLAAYEAIRVLDQGRKETGYLDSHPAGEERIQMIKRHIQASSPAEQKAPPSPTSAQQ